MKCTIQDIANELNLSRNTVSKALRNSESVSATTKNMVFNKAKEMNYKNITDVSIFNKNTFNDHTIKNSILFLTGEHTTDSEFWRSVLKGVDNILSKNDYALVIGIINDKDIKSLKLPPIINNPSIAGVIMVDIYNNAVFSELLKYNLPIVTVDMPIDYSDLIGKVDIITMENKINVNTIVKNLILKGAKRFAFVGDIYSCNAGRGFIERYNSLCLSLNENKLKLDEDCSLLHETSEDFKDFNYILKKIKSMKSLPDVFICGNDITSISLMHALQFLGYNIPDDVSIVGFDNILESQKVSPALTTINTPKEYLGIAAAKQILERINFPNTPCVYSQYSTSLIIRESTK